MFFPKTLPRHCLSLNIGHISPVFISFHHFLNGHFRILKWRYFYLVEIFPYIGLIYGRYLQSIGSWDGQWLPPESYCPNETRVGGGSWLRRPLDPAGSFLFRHGSEDSQRSPSGNWTTTRATHPASSWGGWQGLPDVGDTHRNVTKKKRICYTTIYNQYQPILLVNDDLLWCVSKRSQGHGIDDFPRCKPWCVANLAVKSV